jgi:hypothetical protein
MGDARLLQGTDHRRHQHGRQADHAQAQPVEGIASWTGAPQVAGCGQDEPGRRQGQQAFQDHVAEGVGQPGMAPGEGTAGGIVDGVGQYQVDIGGAPDPENGQAGNA